MTTRVEASNAPGIVVVGGGQAAARAVQALRGAGYARAITLISEESYLPYERPPLSKGVLLGSAVQEFAEILARSYFDENGISVRLGTKAIAIRREQKLVELANGDSVQYDKLLLATGASVRKLKVPGGDLGGVFYLRSMDDALSLGAALIEGLHVVIIGAGFIGLEVAAAAVKRNCEVTVVERLNVVMGRVVASTVASHFQTYHQDAGVKFVLGATVSRLKGEGVVRFVEYEDGTCSRADVVVVGIGIKPTTGLAEAAGLLVDDGIVVDAMGQTTDPCIFAAGDVAKFHHQLLGRSVRLESWHNAQNQSLQVAKNMIGKMSPYTEVPWFWTDQYDLNLQLVGLPETWDEVVIRGNPDEKKFSAIYLADDKIVGANVVNSGRDVRPCIELLKRRISVDSRQLRDPNVSLRAILEAS